MRKVSVRGLRLRASEAVAFEAMFKECLTLEAAEAKAGALASKCRRDIAEGYSRFTKGDEVVIRRGGLGREEHGIISQVIFHTNTGNASRIDKWFTVVVLQCRKDWELVWPVRRLDCRECDTLEHRKPIKAKGEA